MKFKRLCLFPRRRLAGWQALRNPSGFSTEMQIAIKDFSQRTSRAIWSSSPRRQPNVVWSSLSRFLTSLKHRSPPFVVWAVNGLQTGARQSLLKHIEMSMNANSSVKQYLCFVEKLNGETVIAGGLALKRHSEQSECREAAGKLFGLLSSFPFWRLLS